MSNPARKFARRRARDRYRTAIDLLQTLPKPPRANGICACGCVYVPDAGPCPTFIRGANKRCRVCDHDITCHRRKGEAPPKLWNTPNRIKPCPVCERLAIICSTCQQAIPMKEVIEGTHTARCPKCGAIEEPCPGKPNETNDSDKTNQPDGN